MTRRIVVVGSEGGVRRPLPARVATNGADLPVVEGDVADLHRVEVAAAVLVDADVKLVAQAASQGRPLLVDLATIRRLDAADTLATLSAAPWLPLLPHRLAPDVLAAADRLPEIGPVLGGELVTLLGAPAHPTWELDHQPAASDFEALANGLDLLDALGLAVTTSWWLRGPRPPRHLLHRAADGATVAHWVLPAAAAGARSFRASFIGRTATLWLRAPFAPSALTIWEHTGERYRSVRLHRDTPNIQAPDTVRGGLETARLLAGLFDDGTVGSDLRAAAVRAVRTAARLVASHDHSRKDRSA